ncbi:MAG: transcriptional regulator TbsP [Haloferacaceae archaeon]
MGSNLLADRVEDILRSALRDAGDELLVVDPSVETTEKLITVATTFDGDLPDLRVVGEEGVVKRVMDDFVVASNAADLVDEGALSLRVTEREVDNSLLLTPESVGALVTADGAVAALTTEDESFISTAFSAYHDLWGESPEFSLRTPPLSLVRETLEDEIGAQTRQDFEAVLSSLETARGDGEGLDEVTISLLVAARNEVLLYDISKWGEDVGIASKATFSRTKTRLEDLGLIDTEKVPIDVGRPRLRLKLGDDRLRGADSGELASIATTLLD